MEETVETETQHPLENPVVLERLFELIPFNLVDFRNFRLVSRAWNSLSLATWRRNAWLRLDDKNIEEADDDESDIDGNPRISRQKYLDLVENEQLQLVQNPFRKYSLTDWKIKLQSVNRDGEQDQIWFWNRVGPLMTHLEVSFSNFAGVADFRTVIFEAMSNLQSLNLRENVHIDKRPANKEDRLDPKLPQHAAIQAEQVQNNLVELEIDSHDDDDDELPRWRMTLPITWMELIIHFPNLKKLGPLELGATAEAEFLEFFKSAEILRRERGPGYLAHLTDLDLTHFEPNTRTFRGTLLSSINRLHFPLKTLACVIDSSVDEETFKQLLQHPLEYLKVVREHDEDAMPFQNFPFGLKFMTLKELEMSGPIALDLLLFLRECPNLEKFGYNPRGGREANLTLGLNGGNLTKLVKLKCLWIENYLCSSEQIKKLGELMPNMKSLAIGLDDGGFRAVCEVWKELEKLQVWPWRVREEALLGRYERDGEKYHHPNLTDLKSLMKFDIQFQGNRHGFTDAMILDGLLALPNLETVYRMCISSQVSSYARSQLELKFPKCYIVTLEDELAGGNEFAVAAAEFQQNLGNNSTADSR